MQDIHKKAKQFHKWWIYIGGRRIFFCKFDFCCTWVGAAYAKYVCNRSMDRFLRESDDAKLRIHLNECWGWLCGVGILIFHWFSWTFLEPKSFSCLTTFPPSWECRDIQLAGWSGDRVYGIGTNVVFNFSLFKLTSKPQSTLWSKPSRDSGRVRSVSDIPAGDGKINNLFVQSTLICTAHQFSTSVIPAG
jgi:hypothetical protein